VGFVATTTLSPRARAVRSTVVFKITMAVTGLFLIVFLLVHAFGNIKVFMGAEEFDHYAEWLKGDILYPLMPSGWFIWIFRTVMLAAIVLHAGSAWHLARKAKAARGSKYVTRTTLQETYAARTMRWGGVILLGFLIFHLLQFTAKLILTGFDKDATPYEMFVGSFSMWWMVLAYGLWMLTVCMHIRHGFWSGFATLGANTSATTRRTLDALSYGIAILLFVGFMAPPVAVLLGWVN